MDACAGERRAAVTEQVEAEVGALLRLLLKQQLRELEKQMRERGAVGCGFTFNSNVHQSHHNTCHKFEHTHLIGHGCLEITADSDS